MKIRFPVLISVFASAFLLGLAAFWGTQNSARPTQPRNKVTMLSATPVPEQSDRPSPDAASAKQIGSSALTRVAATDPIPSATPKPANSPVAETNLALPVVAQVVDLESLRLTDTQKSIISQLRQEFTAMVSQTTQDPDDPAYVERWQEARQVADEKLRSMLGQTFFQEFQIAATQQVETDRTR